jgi:hypothetical protein
MNGSLGHLHYFKVMWDVITYSLVDLDKHFEGPVSCNIVSSAFLNFDYVEMVRIEPGTVVCVTEVTEF